MFRTLRVRVVMAALVALLGLTAIGHVLPEVTGFVGAAHADECANSSC